MTTIDARSNSPDGDLHNGSVINISKSTSCLSPPPTSTSPPKKKKNPGRSARRRLRNKRDQQIQVVGPNINSCCSKLGDVSSSSAQQQILQQIHLTSRDDDDDNDNDNKSSILSSYTRIPSIQSTVASSSTSWRSDREVLLPAVTRLREAKPQLWNIDLDSIRLRHQLGFVPGNAVAVVARIKDCPNECLREQLLLWQQSDWKKEYHTNDAISNETDGCNCIEDFPLVLQLYPLACRNTYAGGKSQGRNFKGRRRGPRNNAVSSSSSSEPTSVPNQQVLSPLDDDLSSPIVINRKEQVVEPMEHCSTGDVNEMSAGTSLTTTKPARNFNVDPPQQHQQLQQLEADSQQGVVEPFPTMYWLTHPWLRTLVSQLELEHLGTTLEGRLALDATSLASMSRAHLAYGQERFHLLSQDDISRYLCNNTDNTNAKAPSSWELALSPQRGVAGIRNFGSVKCLHAHLAHFLSGGPGSQDNVVGKWTMDAVVERIQQQQQQQHNQDECQLSGAS